MTARVQLQGTPHHPAVVVDVVEERAVLLAPNRLFFPLWFPVGVACPFSGLSIAFRRLLFERYTPCFRNASLTIPHYTPTRHHIKPDLCNRINEAFLHQGNLQIIKKWKLFSGFVLQISRPKATPRFSKRYAGWRFESIWGTNSAI